MVAIYELTRFRVLDTEFDSLEKAKAFINEKLAEKICEELCRNIILNPGDKLKILNNIEKLSVQSRRVYANLFDLDYEEV